MRSILFRSIFCLAALWVSCASLGAQTSEDKPDLACSADNVVFYFRLNKPMAWVQRRGETPAADKPYGFPITIIATDKCSIPVYDREAVREHEEDPCGHSMPEAVDNLESGQRFSGKLADSAGEIGLVMTLRTNGEGDLERAMRLQWSYSTGVYASKRIDEDGLIFLNVDGGSIRLDNNRLNSESLQNIHLAVPCVLTELAQPLPVDAKRKFEAVVKALK